MVGVVTGGGTIFFVFLGAGIGVLGGLEDLEVDALRIQQVRRASEHATTDAGGPRWQAVLLALLLIVGLGVVGAVLIDTFTHRSRSGCGDHSGDPWCQGRCSAGSTRSWGDLTRLASTLLLAAGTVGWFWTLVAAAQAIK